MNTVEFNLTYGQGNWSHTFRVFFYGAAADDFNYSQPDAQRAYTECVEGVKAAVKRALKETKGQYSANIRLDISCLPHGINTSSTWAVWMYTNYQSDVVTRHKQGNDNREIKVTKGIDDFKEFSKTVSAHVEKMLDIAMKMAEIPSDDPALYLTTNPA